MRGHNTYAENPQCKLTLQNHAGLTLETSADSDHIHQHTLISSYM